MCTVLTLVSDSDSVMVVDDSLASAHQQRSWAECGMS